MDLPLSGFGSVFLLICEIYLKKLKYKFMEYSNDKEVVFAFMRRVNYNKTWKEIEFDLGYDFGDYYFGSGDGKELRQKIKDCIKFMKIQFDNVFNKNGNT
jgi:hypothetical protein